MHSRRCYFLIQCNVLCRSCFLSSFINTVNCLWVLLILLEKHGYTVMVRGYLHRFAVAQQITLKYAGKTYMFGERVSCSCPWHVPTFVIKISCNQKIFIEINPRRIPLDTQSTCGKCVYVLACTTYMHHSYHRCIQQYYQGKCKFINIYIYIHLIRLQGYSKHICALGVLIQHMAMAYATSMLPISQGALETSIST